MKDVSEFVPGKKYRHTSWDEKDYVFFVGLKRSGMGIFENSNGLIQPYSLPRPEFWEEYREPVKGSFWLNIYPGVVSDLMCRHSSKEIADKRATPDRIACIEVHYTEGDGL